MTYVNDREREQARAGARAVPRGARRRLPRCQPSARRPPTAPVFLLHGYGRHRDSGRRVRAVQRTICGRKAPTCTCCSAISSRTPRSIRAADGDSTMLEARLASGPTCSIRQIDAWTTARQQVRLQKILSQAGIASRRAAEKLIAEGRVTVNGKTVREMGDEGRSGDRRHPRRRPPRQGRRARFATSCSTSRRASSRRARIRSGGRTVIDLLAGVQRVRLSGRPARLRHRRAAAADQRRRPRGAAHAPAPRRRAHLRGARRGMPDDDAIERLRKGIPLDGRRTLPADVVAAERSGERDRDGVLSRSRFARGATGRCGGCAKRSATRSQTLTRTRIGPLSDRRLKPGDVARADRRRSCSAAEAQAPSEWQSA